MENRKGGIHKPMFIWDFVADTVLGEIVDWIYSQVIRFLGDFFAAMGNMGAELFEMTWVQSIVQFFFQFGWVLYGVGLVVAVFECGIEYQSGRGNMKDAALNAVKGFMAVGLFSVVPVRLYRLCVSLQGDFTAGITGSGSDIGTMANNIISSLQDMTLEEAIAGSAFGGLQEISSPILMIFILIMMGYATIKVFFGTSPAESIRPSPKRA